MHISILYETIEESNNHGKYSLHVTDSNRIVYFDDLILNRKKAARKQKKKLIFFRIDFPYFCRFSIRLFLYIHFV